jgi:hypothetical protein
MEGGDADGGDDDGADADADADADVGVVAPAAADAVAAARAVGVAAVASDAPPESRRADGVAAALDGDFAADGDNHRSEVTSHWTQRRTGLCERSHAPTEPATRFTYCFLTKRPCMLLHVKYCDKTRRSSRCS